MTNTMEAGIADQVCSLAEIVGLLDAIEKKAAQVGLMSNLKTVLRVGESSSSRSA